MLRRLTLVLLMCLMSSVWAQNAPVRKPVTKETEKGWFFFDDPKKEEPKPEEKPPETKSPIPPQLPPPPKEEKCAKKESWSADCGFVNPGTDFQFQAKQRDALMERMVVSKNDPKAVEAFQYYMRWALERSAEVTNLWWYNMVQNPDLDPSVQAPVSAFGLRLMTDVRKGSDKEIFNAIRNEGGMFIYFSRSDCRFCTQMTQSFIRLSRETGIPLRNASLDDKCMPQLTEGCMTAPATLEPAQALQVATVPSMFLYVPGNTWLRIATGVVDLDSMKTRTTQFFSAYRTALLKGVDNSEKGRPSVDFSEGDASGVAKGVEGASGANTVRKPEADDMARLLGAPQGTK